MCRLDNRRNTILFVKIHFKVIEYSSLSLLHFKIRPFVCNSKILPIFIDEIIKKLSKPLHMICPEKRVTQLLSTKADGEI